MRVRLTQDPDGSIVLESPYDAGFVERLKQALPWGQRKWNPDRQRWIISSLVAEDLLRFLAYQGAQVIDHRAPATPQGGAVSPAPPMPPELRAAFDTLYLAYAAPLCVAESAYRALSKYLHPDVGGTDGDFQQINNAMAIIRKYLDPNGGI